MRRNIDTHGHIVVRQITRDFGDEPWRIQIERVEGGQIVSNNQMKLGPLPHEIVDINGILEDMDRLKIDTMAICPPPFLFFYDLSPEVALRAAQIQNDATALLNRDYPDRFAGLAVVPLQDIKFTLTELKRAVDELGFHGIEIGSNVQGTYLGDPRFEPFWEAVADMDLFVFIHPEYFMSHMPQALREYYLMNLVGNPIETALNAGHMVFSGLFERHPTLKVLLAHGGGAMPWLKGRWQHGYKVRPEPKRYLQQSPLESVYKFYVDTIVHDPRGLHYMVETFGPEHVLLGSDFPFDMGPDSPVQEVEELNISDEDKAKILGGNAARLMRLNIGPATT